jgi:O-antigen/teichoic acid export membrane protein
MTFYKWLEVRLLQHLPNTSRQSQLVGGLISGLSAAISGVFLSYLLSATVQTLIVRQLGRLLYGEYATLVAALGLMTSLLGFGLDIWLLNEGGRAPANLARNIAHVLRIKLFGAAILLILVGIAWANQIVQTPAFVVGVIGIICDSLTNTGYNALRALRRNGQVAIFQVIAPLVLLMALLVMQNTTISIFALFCVQAACSSALALILLRRLSNICGPLFGHRFDLIYLVRGAWLFVLSDALSNLYTQSSIVILGRLVDPSAVGLFKPALNIIGFTFLVPSLIFLVGLPHLNAAGLSSQQYRGLVRAMTIGALLYGLAVLIGLWFFADLIIKILFGAGYAAALPLVQMMSLIPLFKAGSFVCVAILLSLDRQRLRVGIQAVIAVASLISGLLIIPLYGLSGAVWLYTVTEALVFLLYFLGAVLAMRRGER